MNALYYDVHQNNGMKVVSVSKNSRHFRYDFLGCKQGHVYPEPPNPGIPGNDDDKKSDPFVPVNPNIPDNDPKWPVGPNRPYNPKRPKIPNRPYKPTLFPKIPSKPSSDEELKKNFNLSFWKNTNALLITISVLSALILVVFSVVIYKYYQSKRYWGSRHYNQSKLSKTFKFSMKFPSITQKFWRNKRDDSIITKVKKHIVGEQTTSNTVGSSLTTSSSRSWNDKYLSTSDDGNLSPTALSSRYSIGSLSSVTSKPMITSTIKHDLSTTQKHFPAHSISLPSTSKLPPTPPPKPMNTPKLRIAENFNYEKFAVTRPAPPVPKSLTINKGVTRLVPVSSFGSSSPVGNGSFDSILKEMKQVQRNGSIKGSLGRKVGLSDSFRNGSFRNKPPPPVKPKYHMSKVHPKIQSQQIINQKYNNQHPETIEPQRKQETSSIISPSRSSSITSAYATDFSQSVQAQVAKFNDQINQDYNL